MKSDSRTLGSVCLFALTLAIRVASAAEPEKALPVATEPAFTNVTWADWEPVNESGLAEPFRPIVLTNAGDGSQRVFVATQHGVIHVLENHDEPQTSRVFLNIQAKVDYEDRENEEGFLGMAFHPDFRNNGQFFVYYTLKSEPHVSVVSRFRVSPTDPNEADPESEEEVWRIQQPYWNHNGGTIVFGPDGYLYIGLGDGGSLADPHGHGQNLATQFGSVLRIDIDHPSNGQRYSIPADNPFVTHKNAAPEIFAYGLRNPWRMAFDRQTGLLWLADVGKDKWEEINIIRSGGNYGWKIREGKHAFTDATEASKPEFIDPIFEYDHEAGKSITGGLVYRGTRVPDLVGKYIYGDYVSNRLWALEYDPTTKAVANYTIPNRGIPMISFGEDESGEVYFLAVSPTGQGIHRFVQR